MKFLSRLRGTKGADHARPQEPRLIGEAEPQYSVSAQEAFVDVLTKGSAAHRPFLAVDDDPVRELEIAVHAALQHCNGELQLRLLAFRNAVIGLSRGAGSEEAVNAAREHFILGCRLALGTND